MLTTKYLWVIHLAVCIVALGICAVLYGQPFFAIVLGVQWLEASFTVGVLLTLLSFVPARPIRRALPQLAFWLLSLGLAGFTSYWVESVADPMLDIGAASFSWTFYLWCAPLLGLYAIGTAIFRVTQWREDRFGRRSSPPETAGITAPRSD